MGGEKWKFLLASASALGSPPRGRGKDGNLKPSRRRKRITPAWAGKSFLFLLWSLKIWDHPRVGGEKTVTRLLRGQWRGSPPRGRGKVLRHFPFITRCGITPAWAGKSFARCGYKCPVGGSPPRGRGKGSGQSGRCIPVRDHPRVGGEKINKSRCQRESVGSPPRGRGKAGLSKKRIRVDRITPAWAGKRL